jgi:hypothetical protein
VSANAATGVIFTLAKGPLVIAELTESQQKWGMATNRSQTYAVHW